MVSTALSASSSLPDFAESPLGLLDRTLCVSIPRGFNVIRIIIERVLRGASEAIRLGGWDRLIYFSVAILFFDWAERREKLISCCARYC